MKKMLGFEHLEHWKDQRFADFSQWAGPAKSGLDPYEELKIGGLNQQKHNSKNCCVYAGLCM